MATVWLLLKVKFYCFLSVTVKLPNSWRARVRRTRRLRKRKPSVSFIFKERKLLVCQVMLAFSQLLPHMGRRTTALTELSRVHGLAAVSCPSQDLPSKDSTPDNWQLLFLFVWFFFCCFFSHRLFLASWRQPRWNGLRLRGFDLLLSTPTTSTYTYTPFPLAKNPQSAFGGSGKGSSTRIKQPGKRPRWKPDPRQLANFSGKVALVLKRTWRY